jgi:hypothetical protein
MRLSKVMGISADLETGIDGDGRVIDRSGDIDQRPPEERTGKDCANVVSFRREVRPCQLPAPAALYVAAPLPAQGFKAPPRELADIAQRLQRDLDKQYAKAKSQLEALTQKIEAQERRCVPPKLDGDLQQIRFQRQKLLIANGPALADCLREEKSSLAALESFKAEHRLTRDAHYPSSPLLAFGILSMLVIMEAGINGVLFADSSDQGLFGGWLEALVLSITNVGAAFLFGRMVLPQLHRRGPGVKAGAFVLCLAGVAAILAINLAGAHYRDFKSEAGPPPAPPAVLKHEASLTLGGTRTGPAAAMPRKAAKPAPAELPAPAPAPVAENGRTKEREAVAKLLGSPFAFDSFMSFFLLVIGLCGACIAAFDGYKLDDPFPGYGKRHRKYAAARLHSAGALQRILGQSNAIMTGNFQAINRKIESFAHEMSTLLNLHQAYAGGRKALQDGLQEAAEDAEAQIAAYDRLLNKVPGPEAGDVYSVAVKTLPPLSEKQVKFYETQERKLKALQKAAQKEQGDVLDLFETASADFQKLLGNASRSSLQAALALPCEEAIGREAGA